MIQITAYLRDEDSLKAWKALPNKTDWLDKALKRISTSPSLSKVTQTHFNGQPVIKTKEDAEKAISYKKTQNWGA